LDLRASACGANSRERRRSVDRAGAAHSDHDASVYQSSGRPRSTILLGRFRDFVALAALACGDQPLDGNFERVFFRHGVNLSARPPIARAAASGGGCDLDQAARICARG